MIRSKKKIISLILAISMIVSMFSGITLNAATPAEDIAAIVGYASNDNADALTIAMLTNAGVTGTIEANLPEYKAAIVLATALQVDTLVEIQAIIDGVDATKALNTAINTIKGYYDDASALTIEVLVAAGVVGAVSANLPAYITAIQAKSSATELDTTVEIQAIINVVNAPAVQVIIEYAANADATAMTIAQLIAAGVTGTVDANLAAYKTAIAAATAAGVATTAQIQVIINNVNVTAIINIIKDYAANDSAVVTIEQLIAAGATGTVVANLAAYQAAIAARTAAEVDTTAKIQSVVTTVNAQVIANALAAAIEVIKLQAANDTATTTKQELLNAGVVLETIIDANLGAYQTAISAATPTQVDTTAKIQALITNKNTEIGNTAASIAAAINVIKLCAANDDASTLTIAVITAAGVTGAVEANLSLYRTAIALAAADGVDTTVEIQTIISVKNAAAFSTALGVIQAYAGTTAAALTIAQLVAVNVTDATEANLAQYKVYIGAATAAGLATTALIQAKITSVNTTQTAFVAAMLVISNYAANDNAGALTIAQLTEINVTGTIDANLAAYKTAIANATSAGADTTAEVQAIIDAVDAAILLSDSIIKVRDYTNSAAAALTIAELTAAGVTGLVSDNLDEYKVAIGAILLATNLDTTSEIQAVINAVNLAEANYLSAIDAIKNYAANDDASQLTIAQLALTRVTPVIDGNLAPYKVAIALATMSAASTQAGIQTIVNTVNTFEANKIITEVIKLYAKNDNAAALTISMLQVALVTGAREACLADYKTAIAGATEEGADSTLELQAFINTINTAADAAAAAAIVAAEAAAVLVINGYAANDNANELTIAKLTAAGITGLVDANLAAYKAAIVASTFALTDTKTEIQDLIDATDLAEAGIAINAIKAYATADNAEGLTIAQLTVAGVAVDKAIAANLAQYKAAIAAVDAVSVDTFDEINAIVIAKNLIAASVASIRDYANNNNAGALTIQILTDAGVATVPANLAAYQVAIAAADGTNADTTAKIQAIIISTDAQQVIVNAIAVITGYATANNADTLTSGELTLTSVTGVVADNVAAYKIAIVAAAAGTDLDTLAEIQALITSVNAAQTAAAQTAAANALAAAVVVISLYAGNDAAAPMTIAELSAAGVTGLVAGNLDTYKSVIAAKALSEADTTLEIQAIIDGVNLAAAVVVIKAYATADSAASMTIAELIAAGVINTVPANLIAYKTAIAAAVDLDTTLKIQAVINAVNTVSSNANITNITIGTVEGTIPAGSSDSSFYPTVNVAIDSTVATISSSNFVLTDSATIQLFTSNDFTTGLVTSVNVTSSTTTLYAKVTSVNGLNVKYYKVEFNVSDSTVKYGVENTPFVKVGSNYVSTVTIDQGQASSLADAKLLLIYTLADGETMVYLQQNAKMGANRIVVSTVGFSEVQVVLIDGDVDWTIGTPIAKSQFKTLIVPPVQ